MTIPQPPTGPEPPAGSGYGPQGPYGAPVPVQTCVFHPGRQTGLRCNRCGRPACAGCLTPASVGFHCTACVAEGRAQQRVPRSVAGARLGGRPVVTFALIGINVLVFLGTAIQANSGVDLNASGLYRAGALSPAVVASGQYWRLLTGGFLHASLTHIALNMLSLYFVGVALERVLGRLRFLVVYLLALLGGSVAVMLFSGPLTPTVGASGAIFGVLGGLVVVFRRFRQDMKQLLFVLAINLYLSFQLAGISWQGHLGGLVVGAAMTAAMVYAPPLIRVKVQVGAAIAVVVLVIALVLVRDTQITTPYCGIGADGYFVDCNGA